MSKQVKHEMETEWDYKTKDLLANPAPYANWLLDECFLHALKGEFCTCCRLIQTF